MMGVSRGSKLRLQTLEARDVPAANDLGAAIDFNAFIFNDLNVFTSDIEGRVAVGGDATLYAYGIGDKLPNSNGTRDDLIVEGDIAYTYGQVFNGNLVYGGNAVLESIGIPNGEDRQETGVVDFAAAQADLAAKSAAWGLEGANGLTHYRYTTLRLRGNHPDLDIFTVTPGQLAASKTIRITAPAGATVLINVPGPAASILNAGIQIDGGIDASRILWNFPDATDVELAGVNFLGNVLAPNASINFNNGQATGTFIANNFTGNGELHFATSNIDIEFLAPVMLSGQVWADEIINGVVDDPPELYYDGADVILQGKDYLGRKVSFTQLSGFNGVFEYTVYPGTYSVRVVPPQSHSTILGDGVPGTVNGNPVGVAATSAVVNIVLGDGENGINYLLPLIPNPN